MQHTKLKLTTRNPRNVMPMAITHLMNITSSQTVYVLYVAVVCTIWRLVCCVLWLHPSLCCPTAFKGVAKLHGDIFEACVPSPLKHVCFHLNESPAIQRFECGDASKIWWNNRFLHWTVTHLCVCTFTPLLIQSARFTTDKPVYYILMVKESTESQLSFTFTPQNGE